MRLILMLALCGLCFAQQATDEEVWKDFAAWSAQVQPLPVGQRKAMGEAFAEYLVKKGVSAEEAQRRFQRASVIRRGSNEREAIYWNASFKLGGGPSDPLRLLQEAVRKVKPGRALDAGTGRGRNAIYIPGLAWLGDHRLRHVAGRPQGRAGVREAGGRLHQGSGGKARQLRFRRCARAAL